MLNANSIEKSSQTSSLANAKAIPRDLKSLLFFLPSSLVSLSLEDCKLSNESFPMDFNYLSMLKELCLDGNSIVSLPDCVRSLCKLETLSMDRCFELKTVVRPPRTLTKLLLDGSNSIEEIVFHPEMSPLKYFLVPEPREDLFRLVEGMVKVEAMTHVAKEVLESLGWGTNLDFIEEQQMEAMYWQGRRRRELEVQMRYEFGIFSTYYQGKEIPNWISDRRKGSSISFTMPSSPNKLRGFNVCYAMTNFNWYEMPDMRISNVTKDCSWTYHWYYPGAFENLIFLSHWMFGKNEMEDGDQVTIDIGYFYYNVTRHERPVLLIKECGISVVYDDGKMEEDPLAYYKSWNYIIGGDLSPFQKHGTGGEYVVDRHSLGWPRPSLLL